MPGCSLTLSLQQWGQYALYMRINFHPPYFLLSCALCYALILVSFCFAHFFLVIVCSIFVLFFCTYGSWCIDVVPEHICQDCKRFRSYCLLSCLGHLWLMAHVNSSWCCVERLTRSVGKSSAEMTFAILTVTTGLTGIYHNDQLRKCKWERGPEVFFKKTNQSLKWQAGEEAKAVVLWLNVLFSVIQLGTEPIISVFCIWHMDLWSSPAKRLQRIYTGLCLIQTGF